MCKKYHIWTPVTCCCENDKYLASVIDDSVITCDEIIDETKTFSTNFNNKKLTYIKKTFYILLLLRLITIALLLTVSIYCYLTKYQAKK